MKFHYQKSRGYTLLFAVITAAVVLGVAVFILSISRGQYLLASTARESTYAIYAADSGIECGVSAIGELSTTTTDKAGDMMCMGLTFQVPSFPDGDDTPTYGSFVSSRSTSLTVNLTDSKCVKITFIRGDMGPDEKAVTKIETRGYNYCKDSGGWGPDTSNPRVVERSIIYTSPVVIL